jgi:hypothetical protein
MMMMMRNDDKSSTCFSCEYFRSIRTKGEERKSSLHYHHHVVIDVFWILLFFFQGCIIMTHNQTHTLYRLSTQCGLIQLHDNLVTWQTDHLDCLFPRGFFSICVWKWRVKSLVQNKRKEERPPPSNPFVVGGIDFSLWARQLQKTKKEKKMMMIIII